MIRVRVVKFGIRVKLRVKMRPYHRLSCHNPSMTEVAPSRKCSRHSSQPEQTSRIAPTTALKNDCQAKQSCQYPPHQDPPHRILSRRVRVEVKVKVKVRVRARVKARVKVRVSVRVRITVRASGS